GLIGPKSKDDAVASCRGICRRGDLLSQRPCLCGGPCDLQESAHVRPEVDAGRALRPHWAGWPGTDGHLSRLARPNHHSSRACEVLRGTSSTAAARRLFVHPVVV